VAKHAYRWLVKTLDEMHILTLADGKALERFAQTYSRWREAEELISVHGQVMVVRREDGSEVPKKNPAVAIASDLAHQLAKLEGDLGLTPAARAGLGVNPIVASEPKTSAGRFFDHFRPREPAGF
jgi:P27 family predicted phage terminase small subunit